MECYKNKTILNINDIDYVDGNPNNTPVLNPLTPAGFSIRTAKKDAVLGFKQISAGAGVVITEVGDALVLNAAGQMITANGDDVTQFRLLNGTALKSVSSSTIDITPTATNLDLELVIRNATGTPLGAIPLIEQVQQGDVSFKTVSSPNILVTSTANNVAFSYDVVDSGANTSLIRQKVPGVVTLATLASSPTVSVTSTAGVLTFATIFTGGATGSPIFNGTTLYSLSAGNQITIVTRPDDLLISWTDPEIEGVNIGDPTSTIYVSNSYPHEFKSVQATGPRLEVTANATDLVLSYTDTVVSDATPATPATDSAVFVVDGATQNPKIRGLVSNTLALTTQANSVQAEVQFAVDSGRDMFNIRAPFPIILIGPTQEVQTPETRLEFTTIGNTGPYYSIGSLWDPALNQTNLTRSGYYDIGFSCNVEFSLTIRYNIVGAIAFTLHYQAKVGPATGVVYDYPTWVTGNDINTVSFKISPYLSIDNDYYMTYVLTPATVGANIKIDGFMFSLAEII